MTHPVLHFDDINHLYWENGVWRPSLTQCLKLAGLVDFSMVNPDVLKAKSILGTNVHELTESWDLYGDVDPAWLNEDNTPYFSAWKRFRSESGFEPIKEYVEWQTVAELFGLRYGVKIDRLGTMNGERCIIEIKNSDTIQDSWQYQLAGQEMAITKRPRCGEIKRMTCRLRRNGTYRLSPPYTNHQWDAQQFCAALTNTYGRLQQGQKLWEKIAA